MRKNPNHYVVIMAGGIGSRFWPMSRTPHPKQFLDILGTGKTLLQQTYDRAKKIVPVENILIVTNSEYRGLVKEQLKGIKTSQMLLEPARRNTAPCVAYAAFRIKAKNPNASMVVAPSDHLILKDKEYVSLINQALAEVDKSDSLITLGITPTRPDTGYGYIQFQDCGLDGICKVKTFTEKPDLEMAKTLVKSGEFLWNAGIFIWSVKGILSAFENLMPEMYQTFQEGEDQFGTKEEKKFVELAYTQCKSISIDYGVMEKAKNVYTIAADIGWSDLGTWGSLYSYSDKDEDGHVIQGRNVLTYDSKNCIVNVPKNKLVVLQGMKDMIVVENDDILLVCRQKDEQQIKRIVNDVKATKGDKFV
ncbi:MAG: mannose-1-phosphate guanylyltransferase [Flavobacteriales bacterium]|nr:mannose-1-phosphate guanylyltransferase [Flavobacteriales bacterium]MCB9190955.1 mannose-1-phosphate guanylyltransferase [Flavobacteriales bacterium]MCB9204810.1 mannose-1-phosphate guanylyltransferase [Flavobacteriales bacterium]